MGSRPTVLPLNESPMEPHLGIEPSLVTYEATVRPSSEALEPSTGIEPVASALQVRRSTFTAQTARWSLPTELNCCRPRTRGVLCH